jgi:hypothetical protein
MSIATAIPGRGENLLTWAGEATLCMTAGAALGVGLVVAPRFVLGTAALGGGLIAAGNHHRLSAWADEHFGDS